MRTSQSLLLETNRISKSTELWLDRKHLLYHKAGEMLHTMKLQRDVEVNSNKVCEKRKADEHSERGWSIHRSLQADHSKGLQCRSKLWRRACIWPRTRKKKPPTSPSTIEEEEGRKRGVHHIMNETYNSSGCNSRKTDSRYGIERSTGCCKLKSHVQLPWWRTVGVLVHSIVD